MHPSAKISAKYHFQFSTLQIALSYVLILENVAKILRTKQNRKKIFMTQPIRKTNRINRLKPLSLMKQ